MDNSWNLHIIYIFATKMNIKHPNLLWLQDEDMCRHHYRHSSSSFSECHKDRHTRHNKTA